MRKLCNKFIIVGLLLVLALSLTGCSGTSVSLYTSSTTAGSRHTLEIRVPQKLCASLESTAAILPTDLRTGLKYDRWNIYDYLKIISESMTLGDGSQYQLVRERGEGTEKVYVLVRDFTPSDDEDEEDDQVEMNVKDYFFFYTVEVTQPNPFNGYRALYDQAEPTLMQALRNGFDAYIDNKKVHIPALDQAFPLIKNCNLDELTLNLYLGGSNRMASDGTKVRKSSEWYSGTFYLWDRKFDTEDTTITLQYYRPNSLGWNIVAIVLAGLTVTAVLLLTRGKKKKHKPTLEERFPYDPSKPDNGGNLPTDSGGFNY